jgi:hypothetical protein
MFSGNGTYSIWTPFKQTFRTFQIGIAIVKNDEDPTLVDLFVSGKVFPKLKSYQAARFKIPGIEMEDVVRKLFQEV